MKADLGEVILIITDCDETDTSEPYTTSNIVRIEIGEPRKNSKSFIEHVLKHPAVVNEEYMVANEKK